MIGRLLFLVFGLAIGALVFHQRGPIVRYLKMERM